MGVQSTYLSASVGNANITARVTLFCELAGEELVEFSAENTVSDELSLLADVGGHFVGRLRVGKRTATSSLGNTYLAVVVQ